VADALASNDVVITTGGLGPTDDDLTRQAVAHVLGLALEEQPAIVESIRARFARRNWQMPEINRRQALVPRGADVLANTRGTAPGLFIDRPDGRVVILLPGPPRELEPMFEDQVVPKLAARTGGRRIYRRTVLTTGRSESFVEEIAQPIYASLGDAAIRVETTILATPGQIELHLSAAGDDAAAIQARLDEGVARLRDALGPIVFSTDGQSLEAVVGDLLARRGWRIAAAESCTGGLLMGRLTSVPGSSGWVTGGVIAYADDVKVRELGVPPDMIRVHGAVSEPVAEAMAAGVRARFGADVGVGITGIAGPGGGSEAKPVGMVIVAVSLEGHASVRTSTFPGDREAVRRHSTAGALDIVRRALL
jgi:nicotinamide-nucleotide amidase